MTKPQFQMSFSLGHLIQMLGLIVAVTMGWMQLESRTSANKDRIESVAQSDASDKTRLRSLERDMARSDERLNSILTILGRIDSRLERMDR